MMGYALIIKFKSTIYEYFYHKTVDFNSVFNTIFIGNCVYKKQHFNNHFNIVFTMKLQKKYNITIFCGVPIFDTKEDAERFFRDKIYHKVVLNTLKGGAK